jgi:hypothetical protein
LVTDPDVFASDARYALRINDEFTIDIMPSIAGYTWKQMYGHIETIDRDGTPLPLLSLEGLLLTKQSLRPKDQLDAAILGALGTGAGRTQELQEMSVQPRVT